jgi:predicted lipoprotein with Yx(FWY)xxD motif
MRLGFARRPLLGLVALAAVGALAAGCGSSNSSSGGSSSATTSAGATTGGANAGGGAYGGYGGGGGASTAPTQTGAAMVLVGSNGRTLYVFDKDQPNQSACSGACVSAWPVDQTSGTPKAGSGVQASLLGTIKRSDGTTQVTYNHHPLYYYSGDTASGQQNGQGLNAFGAFWYVVSPSGNQMT